MDIVTTSNGMVWVSSNDGLARFDGKRFKFYEHVSGDTNSLTNNYCKKMQTDKRGWIWIISDDNLDVFNPATEKFTHIKYLNKQNEKQPVYPFVFYYDRVDDLMWVGTAKGLYFSRNGSFHLQNARAITSNELLTSSEISSIANEGNNFLWITSQQYIIRLNTKNGETEKYELPEKTDNIVNDLNTLQSRCSYFDNNKTLWLGLWISGLVEFNTVTKEFHQYCYRDYKKMANTINSIAQTGLAEQENILWLSTEEFGLTAFDIKQKKFTSYSTQLGKDPFGIKGTTYGLFTDSEKAIWIGSETGLHRYDFNKQLFKKIDLSNIEKGTSFLPISNMAVEKNKLGKDELLWLYIPYKGGYLYHLTEKKFLPLPQKVSSGINLPTELLDIYIDTKNILWIGSIQGGLTGYDIAKDEIVFTQKKPFVEKWSRISCFYEDQNQRLWIGTHNGLFFLDSSREKIADVEKVNNQIKKEELAKSILGITEDESGNIWFTADYSDKKNAFIGKLDPVNDQFIIIYNEKEQKEVNHNPVGLSNIAGNKKGKVFVTFYGEGMAWFNSTGNDPTPHFINSVNGLNSNWVYELSTDNSGNIWCTTGFGLSCYRQSQNTINNYSSTSYALDNTVGPSIYFSQQSGNLYIGQSSGIGYFNTAAKTYGDEKDHLVFTEMKVLNKTYNPKEKLLSDGDIIELNHLQDILSIEFALLNYTNSEDNTFSWILKDWDKDWNTSKNNIASYTNLKPGAYTFMVKAANSRGEWSKETIQLFIIINPPFYKTWWFILLCILALAGIAYWLVQQRINRIKERFQLRNKIAADLHDEIGSTLTSISILSNVSLQAMEQQPQQTKEMLEQISVQSKNIQQNMSDIVWSIRPDNEKIENLVTRMREYAAQTLEPMDITITITADESLLNKVLPMECRKELLLIYKEAINNIAKHAEATVVSVSLANGNRQVKLSIADNGKWKGNNSGTGTKSMKDRAHALGGSLSISIKETGTVVSATVPVT